MIPRCSASSRSAPILLLGPKLIWRSPWMVCGACQMGKKYTLVVLLRFGEEIADIGLQLFLRISEIVKLRFLGFVFSIRILQVFADKSLLKAKFLQERLLAVELI